MTVLLLGCGGAFVFGLVRDEPLITIAGPLGVALLTVAVAFALADRAAADDFFRGVASGLGLTYARKTVLPTYTPLLSAGDRRWAEHWMRTDGGNGLAGLGHFVWEELDAERDSDGLVTREVEERGRLTVCLMENEPSMALFRGVFLRPRRGLFEAGTHDWLADTRSRRIELESAGFTERYELRIADDQDEGVVRELFAPTLVSWLAGHPLAPGFEVKGGAVVTFVGKALDDAGMIAFFLEAARHIGARVDAEVLESVRR